MSKIITFNFRKTTHTKPLDYFEKGCVQYKNGRAWCPRKKWYLEEECPFKSRYECDLYKELCGKRIR